MLPKKVVNQEINNSLILEMCGDDSKESAVLLILNWWEWEPTYCVEGKDGGSDKTPMQVKIEYPPPIQEKIFYGTSLCNLSNGSRIKFVVNFFKCK